MESQQPAMSWQQHKVLLRPPAAAAAAAREAARLATGRLAPLRACYHRQQNSHVTLCLLRVKDMLPGLCHGKKCFGGLLLLQTMCVLLVLLQVEEGRGGK